MTTQSSDRGTRWSVKDASRGAVKMNRIAICGFCLMIVLLSCGCTDPCNNNEQMAVARQYITDATEVIEDSFEHSVRTVSLPTLSEGQTLLIAGPYQITKRWLKANTTLNPGQQSLLIDLSNWREQVSIAVISASCLLQDAYLETISKPSIVRVVGTRAGCRRVGSTRCSSMTSLHTAPEYHAIG